MGARQCQSFDEKLALVEKQLGALIRSHVEVLTGKHNDTNANAERLNAQLSAAETSLASLAEKHQRVFDDEQRERHAAILRLGNDFEGWRKALDNEVAALRRRVETSVQTQSVT